MNLQILLAFLFFKHQRIVPRACCSSRVLLSQCLSIPSVYSMVKNFRILIPFRVMQQIGKTVNARQRRWMLLPQHPFRQRQCLSMHLLGLFVSALTAQHPCQIIHAPKCIRMLLPQKCRSSSSSRRDTSSCRFWYINHVLSDLGFLDGIYVPQSYINLAVNEKLFQ